MTDIEMQEKIHMLEQEILNLKIEIANLRLNKTEPAKPWWMPDFVAKGPTC
jgi:hypothetical protein